MSKRLKLLHKIFTVFMSLNLLASNFYPFILVSPGFVQNNIVVEKVYAISEGEGCNSENDERCDGGNMYWCTNGQWYEDGYGGTWVRDYDQDCKCRECCNNNDCGDSSACTNISCQGGYCRSENKGYGEWCGDSRVCDGGGSCVSSCTPSCGNTGDYCRGLQYNDGCGGSCWGTQEPDCGDASNHCSGETFNSSNDCGSCTGTKDCSSGGGGDTGGGAECSDNDSPKCEGTTRVFCMGGNWVEDVLENWKCRNPDCYSAEDCGGGSFCASARCTEGKCYYDNVGSGGWCGDGKNCDGNGNCVLSGGEMSDGSLGGSSGGGCTPNCGDTNSQCMGLRYSDGCGGTCWGTQRADCSDASNHCMGESFNSKNDCGGCTGIKDCGNPNACVFDCTSGEQFCIGDTYKDGCGGDCPGTANCTPSRDSGIGGYSAPAPTQAPDAPPEPTPIINCNDQKQDLACSGECHTRSVMVYNACNENYFNTSKTRDDLTCTQGCPAEPVSTQAPQFPVQAPVIQTQSPFQTAFDYSGGTGEDARSGCQCVNLGEGDRWLGTDCVVQGKVPGSVCGTSGSGVCDWSEQRTCSKDKCEVTVVSYYKTCDANAFKPSTEIYDPQCKQACAQYTGGGNTEDYFGGCGCLKDSFGIERWTGGGCEFQNKTPGEFCGSVVNNEQADLTGYYASQQKEIDELIAQITDNTTAEPSPLSDPSTQVDAMTNYDKDVQLYALYNGMGIANGAGTVVPSSPVLIPEAGTGVLDFVRGLFGQDQKSLDQKKDDELIAKGVSFINRNRSNPDFYKDMIAGTNNPAGNLRIVMGLDKNASDDRVKEVFLKACASTGLSCVGEDLKNMQVTIDSSKPMFLPGTTKPVTELTVGELERQLAENIRMVRYSESDAENIIRSKLKSYGFPESKINDSVANIKALAGFDSGIGGWAKRLQYAVRGDEQKVSDVINGTSNTQVAQGSGDGSKTSPIVTFGGRLGGGGIIEQVPLLGQAYNAFRQFQLGNVGGGRTQGDADVHFVSESEQNLTEEERSKLMFTDSRYTKYKQRANDVGTEVPSFSVSSMPTGEDVAGAAAGAGEMFGGILGAIGNFPSAYSNAVQMQAAEGEVTSQLERDEQRAQSLKALVEQAPAKKKMDVMRTVLGDAYKNADDETVKAELTKVLETGGVNVQGDLSGNFQLSLNDSAQFNPNPQAEITPLESLIGVADVVTGGAVDLVKQANEIREDKKRLSPMRENSGIAAAAEEDPRLKEILRNLPYEQVSASMLLKQVEVYKNLYGDKMSEGDKINLQAYEDSLTDLAKREADNNAEMATLVIMTVAGGEGTTLALKGGVKAVSAALKPAKAGGGVFDKFSFGAAKALKTSLSKEELGELAQEILDAEAKYGTRLTGSEKAVYLRNRGYDSDALMEELNTEMMRRSNMGIILPGEGGLFVRPQLTLDDYLNKFANDFEGVRIPSEDEWVAYLERHGITDDQLVSQAKLQFYYKYPDPPKVSFKKLYKDFNTLVVNKTPDQIVDRVWNARSFDDLKKIFSDEDFYWMMTGDNKLSGADLLGITDNILNQLEGVDPDSWFKQKLIRDYVLKDVLNDPNLQRKFTEFANSVMESRRAVASKGTVPAGGGRVGAATGGTAVAEQVGQYVDDFVTDKRFIRMTSTKDMLTADRISMDQISGYLQEKTGRTTTVEELGKFINALKERYKVDDRVYYPRGDTQGKRAITISRNIFDDAPIKNESVLTVVLPKPAQTAVVPSKVAFGKLASIEGMSLDKLKNEILEKGVTITNSNGKTFSSSELASMIDRIKKGMGSMNSKQWESSGDIFVGLRSKYFDGLPEQDNFKKIVYDVSIREKRLETQMLSAGQPVGVRVAVGVKSITVDDAFKNVTSMKDLDKIFAGGATVLIDSDGSTYSREELGDSIAELKYEMSQKDPTVYLSSDVLRAALLRKFGNGLLRSRMQILITRQLSQDALTLRSSMGQGVQVGSEVSIPMGSPADFLDNPDVPMVVVYQ